MSNIPETCVAPKRFLVPRSTLNPRSGSPSRYSTTSTMCSSILGPASPPSLVTWPTSTTATPVVLANRTSRAALFPDLSNATGRGPDLGHAHGLDGVDYQQGGALSFGKGDDCIDVIIGDQADGIMHDPQPAGTHRDLLGRLLGAGHHHRIAPGGQGPRQLEEKGRLADARLTAQEQHRSCDHPTAQNAVDLPPAGHDAIVRLLSGRPEANGLGRPDLQAGFAGYLRQRLARPALRAETHPLGRSVPAGLTSKCHDFFLFRLTIAPLNGENQGSHKCCEHDRRGQD